MTATVNVERIDIIEGPNLATLLRPMIIAEGLTEADTMTTDWRDVNASFELVKFYPRDGEELIEDIAQSSMLPGLLIGIRTLGDMSYSKHDYVIRVIAPFGIFEGSYNTKTRKGSLALLRS